MHFDGVRACGHDGAGHDAHAFARADGAGKGTASDGFADEGEGVAAVCGEGVAVHRGDVGDGQFDV